MKAIRATEEWQKAGVHYVRYVTMCQGFHVTLEMEFGQDKPDDQYVLVMDGDDPVATCRVHYLGDGKGQIERVATLPQYHGKHYGAAAITEAENWMRENGVTQIYINSRTAVVGFYEKLGYTPDYNQVTGSGTFECVMTHKGLAASKKEA